MGSRQFLKSFSKKTYQQRRKALLSALSKREKNFVAIFFSGKEMKRNSDTKFPFRVHSDFFYLTGFEEPESFLFLSRSGAQLKSVLACRPRDRSNGRGSEVWEGERLGVERAVDQLGVDEAISTEAVDEYLKRCFQELDICFWDVGEFCELDQKILQFLALSSGGKQSSGGIHGLLKPSLVLHELRKKKSAEEIKMMRASAKIASDAHRRAMQIIQPGMNESQIEAEVVKETKKRGALQSYNPIVAAGNNANTLHYSFNDQDIKKGDLLLMDAGAELSGYASDITRTFPAAKEFSAAQKEVYQWVLKAQESAIAVVKPGVSWKKPHEAALKVICKALSAMKVVKKSPAEIQKKKLWQNYFPHGTSHWIGLDVHDVGRYVDDHGKPIKLEKGNVLTIEPGLYFRSNDRSVPEKFRGIGIRIEDDVLVTASGADVLSSSCPKTIEEIEALRVPRM